MSWIWRQTERPGSIPSALVMWMPLCTSFELPPLAPRLQTLLRWRSVSLFRAPACFIN
jgi:hypothetical protein